MNVTWAIKNSESRLLANLDIDGCKDDKLKVDLPQCIMHTGCLEGRHVEEGFKILNPRKCVQQTVHFNNLKLFTSMAWNLIPAWDCYQLVDLEGNLFCYKANVKCNK